jgi:hypothetical protein
MISTGSRRWKGSGTLAVLLSTAQFVAGNGCTQSGVLSPGAAPRADDALPSHAPIRIVGDGEFTAQNGVVNPHAAGTKADPYVVGPFDVNGGGSPCISVSGTTKAFVLRRVRCTNGTVGFELTGVSGARIVNPDISGIVGSFGHFPAGAGGSATGIEIEGSNDVSIQGGSIEFVYGGSGGAGFGIGDAANGGDGGDATGIRSRSSSNVKVSGTNLSDIYGGAGAAGGVGSGRGGAGGNATAVSFDNGTNIGVSEVRISGRIYGGAGGAGAVGLVADGGRGGDGGAATGIQLRAIRLSNNDDIRSSIADNEISDVKGGAGAAGAIGLNGGDGGQGGAARGIAGDSSGWLDISRNRVADLYGAAAGAGAMGAPAMRGGNGGDGADASGVFCRGCRDVSVTENTLSNLNGAVGSSGAAGNAGPAANSGSGGDAAGIDERSCAPPLTNRNNRTSGAHGGWGAAGSVGLPGGDGGDGGDGVGIRIEKSPATNDDNSATDCNGGLPGTSFGRPTKPGSSGPLLDPSQGPEARDERGAAVNAGASEDRGYVGLDGALDAAEGRGNALGRLTARQQR